MSYVLFKVLPFKLDIVVIFKQESERPRARARDVNGMQKFFSKILVEKKIFVSVLNTFLVELYQATLCVHF